VAGLLALPDLGAVVQDQGHLNAPGKKSLQGFLPVEVGAVVPTDDPIFEEGTVRVEEAGDLVGIVAATVGVDGQDVQGVGLGEECAEVGTQAAPVTEDPTLIEDVKGMHFQFLVVQALGPRIDGGVEQGQVDVEDQVQFPRTSELLCHASVQKGSLRPGHGDVVPALDKDPGGLLGLPRSLRQDLPTHRAHASAL
jgi:hypothetical protein